MSDQAAGLREAVSTPAKVRPPLRVIAVTSGKGGVGKTHVSANLAVLAAKAGRRVLLIDADALGGGLDILLGIEDVPGVRWPELADTRGRLGAQSLEQALPSYRGLSVLSWGRSGPISVSAESTAAVLDAAIRGFDLVIIDVPLRGHAARSVAPATSLRTDRQARP